MKKHTKKVLGYLGLALVATTTAVAIVLPGPDTSAASQTSVTDTVTVRVVGSVPNVTILGIDNREIITVPEQAFTLNYENSETVTVSLRHTDLEGNVQNYELDSFTADYNPGSESYNIYFIK